ncbi:MAG: GTP-binding protein [Promethearchaeota archaeon]|nr:MAG: GTP-binding protein [Candidatus Lokiarchaeota archaeon]
MKGYDDTIKIMVFGDNSGETTSLSVRYISGLFLDDLRLTIGVDFYSKTLNLDDKKIKLQIWDFGGGERFRFLLPTYARGACGGLFVYDITNSSSIAHIDDWLSALRQEIRAEDIFPILAVGIKPDEICERQITAEEGIKIAKSRNLNGFIECNLKTGENVEKVFEALIRLILADKNYNIKKAKRMFEFSVIDFELKKRNRKSYPKKLSKPPIPSPPLPLKPPGAPAMDPQGKESYPYPIFNSRFLNWSRGARWTRCPNCMKKFSKEKFYNHSCKIKPEDPVNQHRKSSVRLSGAKKGELKHLFSRRALSRKKSRSASDSQSGRINRSTAIVGVSIDPQLKGEVQAFIEWIKDSEGLSGYINYYLSQNNQSIISELSKIYAELRQIIEESLKSSKSFNFNDSENIGDENYDGDDYLPYPYIFTHPKPPDDFEPAPQSQLRAPLKEKDSKDEISCQYCGRELTKEEQLTHSCQKKP